MAGNLKIIIITLHPLSYLSLAWDLISKTPLLTNVKATPEQIYKQETSGQPPPSSAFGHEDSNQMKININICSQHRLDYCTLTENPQYLIDLQQKF